MQKYKHLFGPVDSRRLGRSLGVDLVSFKTCSLDCVYCECGKTTTLSNTPQLFVPTNQVIAELNQFLAKDPNINYITFSGGGEPTLASNLPEVIAYIKKNLPQYKVSLLTNATELKNSSLRQALLGCDIIVPSLDAVSEAVFTKINRPAPGINAADIVDSLIKLRQEYSGQIWLEIFIIRGVNDSPEELALLKDAAQRIRPDKIQLNSLDRTGTEQWVKPESRERLEEIALFFKPLTTEIIARANKITNETDLRKATRQPN